MGVKTCLPLFTTARTWKQPRCSSTDEWIKKLWYIYTMEYCKSHSVVSDSLWPHRLYHPWNSPGQNTGVGSLSSSRGSSQPRDQTQVSCITGRFFTTWATREAPMEHSVQFSHSIVCDSLQPHELQHARPPCPSPTYVHWVSNAIQPSHPLSSPSPAPTPSQHQGLFQWVNSSHQVAKVLEFQLQHQSFQWTPRTDLL